jgi:hypothetical protein
MEEQEEVKLTGKDKFLSRMKEKNPEYAPESDDMLFDDIEALYSENEGKLNSYSQSNQKLAEIISKDPKIGAVLSMIVGENAKSFPYAVAKVYGKGVFDMEGEDLEEYERGHQEYLGSVDKMNSERSEIETNVEEYKSNLEKFQTENGLNDAQIEEIHKAIVADAENFLKAKVPMEYIDYKWKGMNYERDVQDAADTGFVEGKNTKIDLGKKKPDTLPDLGAAVANSTKKVEPKKKAASFYEGIPT